MSPPLVPVETVELEPGRRLAYRRIRGGGTPVLLVHGFPCTSLVWARVMQPLADAGLDVVAPDLRGYGDSDPGDLYDLASLGGDLVGLTDALGWSTTTVAGHDLGASVLLDMANRHPDRVERLLLMNHVVPERGAGFATWSEEEAARIFGYAVEQGHHADALMARLPTEADRRAYVEAFYTQRGWCPRDAFTATDLDLLVTPYADARRLRTSFVDYEIAAGRAPSSGPELLDRPVRQPVMVVLGLDDVTLVPDAVARCHAAYPALVDVVRVPDAGHFLQYERPGVLVQQLLRLVGLPAGRSWLAAMPDELHRQRDLLSRLLDVSEATPEITSLSVGCSLGRGAGDALSDVDAAIGVDAPVGEDGAQRVLAVEEAVVASCVTSHSPVGVLRDRVGPPGHLVRRVLARHADGVQLDLAVTAEPEVRRGDAAPDFVTLFRRTTGSGSVSFPPALVATSEQVHEWTFLGWVGLADLLKYLERGSLWEAHQRLQQVRDRVWALWAAAHGAAYPWHGLSQVLDHDPDLLPPGIEATVARLEAADLLRAATVLADLLRRVSGLAAARCDATLPDALADQVHARLR